MQACPRVATQFAVRLASSLLAVAASAPGAFAADATTQPAAHPSRSTPMAPTDPGGYFTLNQLKPLAGERIGAWKRTDVKVPLESRARPQAPTVLYGYRHGKLKAIVTLRDAGAIAAASDAAQWKGPPNRRETESGREHVYREGGHTVREVEKRDAPGREVVLILTNGIVISASGEGVDMAALKALADGVSVTAAEALVRPGK
jgi:hypothetical protein